MSDAAGSEMKSKSRLVDVALDDGSISRGNADIEHEREVAIFDLLESNLFEPEGREDGPYILALSIAGDRLVLAISDEAGKPIVTHQLSLTPLKRVMRDYFIVLDSYYQSIRSGQPSRIETIDMGRRGLHDEGGRVVMERLDGKVGMDFDTARRLFTLIAALHWKG